MTKASKGGGHRQGGQAMVEMVIVAAFVLLPLFLAIPIIGKYLDVRTATVEASRYAAWERTVWYGGAAASNIGWFGSTNSWHANQKTDDEIRKEIAVRLLSETGAADAFTASDMSATGFKYGAARKLWSGHDGTALLADYDEVGNTVGNADAPGTMNRVIDPIATLAATLGPFTLEMKGEYKAAVTVNLKDYDRSTFLPTSTKLMFSETNVLLANGWGAGGPDGSGTTSVKDQVAGLTPTSIFDNKVTNVITTILSIAFPEFAKLKLGTIDPEVVPEDRLQ